MFRLVYQLLKISNQNGLNNEDIEVPRVLSDGKIRVLDMMSGLAS
jgi:hypothetical protein